MKTPTLTTSLSILVLLIVFVLFAFITIALVIAGIAAVIVGLTFVYGIITNQSYNRVCDNSEIVYKLNNIGKWTLVAMAGFGVIYLLYSFGYLPWPL